MSKWVLFWLGCFCLSCAAQHRVLVSGSGYGEVAVYAKDGSQEWSCLEEESVCDAWLLPNDDIAMAYEKGARIIRPNWTSGSGYEVVLDRPVAKGGETHTCMPLPEGGFLVGESFDGVSYIIELDDAFAETKRIELKGLGGKHSTFRQISKTSQGTYLITQQRKGGVAMEISSDGEIVRRFPDGKYAALRLENGNTVLACGDNHRILVVDPQDRIVWSLEQNDLPDVSLGYVAGLQWLPNGNILFCNWGGHGGASGPSLIEVSPDKQIVWSASPGIPHRVSNVKVL